MIRDNLIHAAILGYSCTAWDSNWKDLSHSTASLVFRMVAWPLKALREKELTIWLIAYLSSVAGCFVTVSLLHIWLSYFWCGLIVMILNTMLPVPILTHLYGIPKGATMLALMVIAAKLFPWTTPREVTPIRQPLSKNARLYNSL